MVVWTLRIRLLIYLRPASLARWIEKEGIWELVIINSWGSVSLMVS